jgi:hypothetical protein
VGVSCALQGLVLQFFNLSSFLWTSCFAAHLFQLMGKRNSNAEVRCLSGRACARACVCVCLCVYVRACACVLVRCGGLWLCM